MVFNDINISGKEIWEVEHCDIPKKIELGFEIGLPASETQFSKTVTKKGVFFTYVVVNVSRVVSRI